MSDLFNFVNSKGSDKRYMVHENEYMNRHPIGNPKVGEFHSSAVDQHLANNHGGHRTQMHVRADIRTGLHMLKDQKSWGGGLLSAERLGYDARKHLYLNAEAAAKGKK